MTAHQSRLEWAPPAPRPPGAQAWTRPAPRPYLAAPDLVEVVNLAIYLERPLLLRGEPGCGKTRLAERVGYDLGLNVQEWYIKSTSRARDGLYVYDSIGRLRDAYLSRLDAANTTGVPAVSADPRDYINFGPLGKAFASQHRTVVLIDEIDKADIDFPNDLLRELDEGRFTVEETGEEIVANAPPIVFVTSNNEKDLPDAFLRRCLFHYIDFPAHDQLIAIVNAHFPGSSDELLAAAVKRFEALRNQMVEDKGEAGKRVSTSELIDWFKALRRHPDDEVLARLEGKLPYPSVLLKAFEDHIRYLDETGDDAGAYG